MSDIETLIAAAQQSSDPAARKLADVICSAIADPNRKVGAAFRLRPRGGNKLADKRRERDQLLRLLATATYGTVSLSRIELRELLRRINRYRASPHQFETDSNAERQLLRRIDEIGLPTPGERQALRILSKS